MARLRRVRRFAPQEARRVARLRRGRRFAPLEARRVGAAAPPLFRASRGQCEAPMVLHVLSVLHVLHVLPLVLHVLRGLRRGCAAFNASLTRRRGGWIDLRNRPVNLRMFEN